jgi:membrane protease subunit HflC
MQAERQRIAKQYRSEGKERAQVIRAETNRERDVLLADAYEKEQNLKGIGDARSIDINAKAFSQDPDFFAFLKSLQAYRNSLKEKTTLILPAESEFLQYLQGAGSSSEKKEKKGGTSQN